MQITSIGDVAFAYCKSLTSITFSGERYIQMYSEEKPEEPHVGLIFIYYDAFGGCGKLETIKVSGRTMDKDILSYNPFIGWLGNRFQEL
jgi:hypothetical protein